jgi:hypothetical protein
MAIHLMLEDDEALVLFELLASKRLEENLGIPERNACWALQGALENLLVAPFSPDYAALLEQARQSLMTRHGD